MSEITRQSMEKALEYIAETDEPAARAKGLRKALERAFHTIEAAAFIEATGAIGERKQTALASKEYREHTSKFEDAVYEDELLSNKRNRAFTTIDVWRSLNSSRNKGNIT